MDGTWTHIRAGSASILAPFARTIEPSAHVLRPRIAAPSSRPNAYGLGLAKVATALFREGCRAFFVARFCEAKSLARTIGTAAEIYVLNGIEPGNEATCAERRFIPVLNSLSQVNRWRAVARRERASAARGLAGRQRHVSSGLTSGRRDLPCEG